MLAMKSRLALGLRCSEPATCLWIFWRQVSHKVAVCLLSYVRGQELHAHWVAKKEFESSYHH